MPRQIFRDNQMDLMSPVAAGVARLGSDIGAGITGTEQAFQQQEIDRQNEGMKQENKSANQKAFAEVKGFFGSVNGVRLDGLEPKKNEPNAEYIARLKTAAPQLVQQLKDAGADPEELKKAMAIPGFALDDVKKLIYHRTGSQLEKQLLRQPATADTIADVRAGFLSLDELNRKNGTNLTKDEYDAIAWGKAPTIAPPQLPPGQMGPPAPINYKALAAAQQPLSNEEASKLAGVNQPLSYANANYMVQTADLSPDDRTRFNTILNTVANREASHIAKKPDMTQTKFFGETMAQGLPLTDEQKQLAMGLKADQDAANKARYNSMRQKEQDNSLLRILVQNAQFNATMEKEYGKTVAATITQLNKKLIEYQDLQNQLNIAMGTTDAVSDKEIQDPTVIMDKMRLVDDEIQQLRSKVPDLERHLYKYKSQPTTIRMPVMPVPENPIIKNPPAPAKKPKKPQNPIIKNPPAPAKKPKKPLAAFEK